MFTKPLKSLSCVPPPVGQVFDPVCGAAVDVFTAPVSVIYSGVTYHFCSEHCYAYFSRQLAKYYDEGAVSVYR